MSLLEDLQNIDLSAIVEARGTLSVTVSSDDVQGLIDSGAAQAALGQIGTLIGQLEEAIENPEVLLEPLINTLLELLDDISIDGVSLEPYVDAVKEGIKIIGDLLEGFDGRTGRIGAPMGISFSSAFEQATSALGSQRFVSLEDSDGFIGLIEQVENGVSRDPFQFAQLAVEALVPFPIDDINVLRENVDVAIQSCSSLSLPESPTAALVEALNAVATLAAGNDTAALEAALRDLERVHAETVQSIQGHIQAFIGQVNELPLVRVLDRLSSASLSIQTKDLGFLEFLERWRLFIVDIRNQFDNRNFEEVIEGLEDGMDIVEAIARDRMLGAMDEAYARLESWVRNLLRQLGLRKLRAEISDFFLSVANKIREADIGRFAREAQDLLNEIEQVVSSPTLIADIQANLGDVFSQIDNVVGTFETQLTTIIDTIENTLLTAAEEINRVLGEAVAAIQAFKTALEQVQSTIDNLGIEAAGDDIISTLTELRSTAEDLLSIAPLPDSLRPVIEQLIAQIEGIDLDAVILEPVESAAAQIQIPDSAADFLEDVLESVSEVLSNLIPEQLIEEISAEMNQAIETLLSFDPTTLLSEVTSFLTDAAEFIRQLDPNPLPDSITAPFDTVLQGLDQLHPVRLMAPVIEAYESALGSISLTEPEALAEGLSGLFNSALESAGSAMMGQASSVVPGADTAAQEAVPQTATQGTSSSTPANAPASTPSSFAPTNIDQDENGIPYIDRFKPGDIVRMIFGYVPSKIREALESVEESAAGEMLESLDALCGGLARDIRSISGELRTMGTLVDTWLEENLVPLGQANLQARLAVNAHVSTNGFDVQAAATIVARSDSAPIRSSLNAICTESKQATTQSINLLSGSLAGRLEQTAGILEGCLVGQLGTNLEAILDALDPEPIAAEMDALIASVVDAASSTIELSGEVLRSLADRVLDLMRELNPANQAVRLLGILDVLREELDLLNPRLLANELGEIHAAIRQSIAVYDPDIFAKEIGDVVQGLATTIEGLDPTALLGNLDIFDTLRTRLEALDPAALLGGIGDSISAVGAELMELDPRGVLDSLNGLAPRIAEVFGEIVLAIQQEIIALLRAIQYASGVEASVSVEVSTS